MRKSRTLLRYKHENNGTDILIALQPQCIIIHTGFKVSSD